MAIADTGYQMSAPAQLRELSEKTAAVIAVRRVQDFVHRILNLPPGTVRRLKNRHPRASRTGDSNVQGSAGGKQHGGAQGKSFLRAATRKQEAYVTRRLIA